MRTAPTTAAASRLLAENGYPLVSIYMPTHRAGADIWQDPIRFKNLIRSARHDLETASVSERDIDELLRPLSDRLEDREFWQYQADGLAVFRSRHRTEEFRLPTPVPELSVVAPRFHLKPLLMALADERPFFVLALSQNSVRLYSGSEYGLHEVNGLNLPPGLEVKSRDNGKSLQSHTARSGTQIPHAAEVDHKAQIAAYCHRIDQALDLVLGPNDLTILAAVDYIAAIYRDGSSLRTLAAETISGSPDNCGEAQLFEKAFPIAKSHFDRLRSDAEDRFFQCLSLGKALDRPLETIRAAQQGRVDTLFVPIGVHIWGETGTDGEIRVSASHRPQDQDLLNVALISTWESGGRVLAMPPDQMPGGRQIAAITRF
ncbi:MAG: hypothetical protein ABI823_06035 [Bryobacteraceae bacterium]